MTIKLPSFPRELVGSDRLLSLSLSLQDSFFLQDGEKRSFFSSFLIAVVQQQLDRWIVWKNEDGKCAKRFPHSSLSLSLLFEACLCLYSFGEKKEDVGRLLSSTHWIACGSRRNDLVCRDHRFHRDTGSGSGSGVDGNVFSVFFPFFFYLDDAAEIGIVTPT